MSEPSMDLVCVACGRDYGAHIGDYCHPPAARSVPPSMFTPAPDPRDAEIAALCARVAELEALTPPGHVLVGPDARERIAEANRTAEKQRNLDCTCGDQGGGPCVTCRRYDLIVADAVLRALGVRGGA